MVPVTGMQALSMGVEHNTDNFLCNV